MGYKARNNANSALATTLSDVATVLSVSPGTGDRFPSISGSDYTFLTLQSGSGAIEIVKVSSRALGADSMTIERAQEGTSAAVWPSGTLVSLRLTAGTMQDALAHKDAATGAHAATAISVATAGLLVATTVQAALEWLTARITDIASLAEAVAGSDNVKPMTPLRVRQASVGTNLLRNAQGLVNQRNVSGTVTLTAGAYGHDGMKAGASGCQYTFSTANGVTTFTLLSGSFAPVVLGTDLANDTNTYCLSNTGTAQMRINGGSYASAEVTASLTYGSNVTCEFAGTAGATGYPSTVVLPQFEIGSSRSRFDTMGLAEYRFECFKAYWAATQVANGSFGIGYQRGVNSFVMELRFPRPMRVAPALSVQGASADYAVILGGTTLTVTSITLVSLSDYSVIVEFVTSAGTVGQAGRAIASAGTRSLFFSAEV